MVEPIFYADVEAIVVKGFKAWDAPHKLLPEEIILAATVGVVVDTTEPEIMCDVANATGNFVRKEWKALDLKKDMVGCAILDDGYGEPRIIRSFATPIEPSPGNGDGFEVAVYLRGASQNVMNKLLKNILKGEVNGILKKHGFNVCEGYLLNIKKSV